MGNHHRPATKKRQTGSALITGLIILLLMMIIGTAGMRTTIMEERMAGNSRDLNNAFQAAESGLLDGEQDLRNKDPVTQGLTRAIDYDKTNFAADCGLGNATNRDFDGLCLPVTVLTDPPRWLAINWSATGVPGTNPLPYREYGQHTEINGSAPPDLPSVSRQPRYILEYLGSLGSLVIGKAKPAVTTYFRVTTQGYGIAMTDANEPIARIMLQSVYGK